MYRIWQHIETSAWLTVERARGYSFIVLALAGLALIGWVALSKDGVDLNGKPIGTDFSSFYAAGSLAWEGRSAAVYDAAVHYARQQQIFGPSTPYYAWFYPPIFLLIVTPLALLPYPLALAVWQGGSLLFYLWVIGAILRRADMPAAVRRAWLPVAIGFPAVLVNVGHGQNGLLTAGLFGGALLALPRKPVFAGILFATMAYKPQFGLVIPLALLAGRQWRCLLAATITVIALVAITSALFGIDCWPAFAATTNASRTLLLEQGEVGLEKLQSAFAAVRMWNGGVALAYLTQGAVAIVTIGWAVWTWYRSDDANLKAAMLLIATLLASPHVLDYDLMILGPAIAFLVVAGVTNGFRSYEISLLALAWIMPLLARSIAGAIGLPLGLMVTVALFVFVVRRAVADCSAAQRIHLEIATM